MLGNEGMKDFKREVIRAYLRADAVEQAYREVYPVVRDYIVMAAAGTATNRAYLADEQLREIETHARALCKRLARLTPLAEGMLYQYRYVEQEAPGLADEWLASIPTMLEPLAAAANGARAQQVGREILGLSKEPDGRGAPQKRRPSPREQLARDLVEIYMRYGSTDRKRRRRGEEAPAHAFARAVAASIGATLPEDIGKLLRGR